MSYTRRAPAADLELGLQVALETTEQDLALTRLQTIDDGGNGADIIRHREKNELAIDEVIVCDLISAMVDVCTRLELKSDRDIHALCQTPNLEFPEPVLSLICLLFTESKVNQWAFLIFQLRERNHMGIHATEVILRVLVGACTQSLSDG